MNPIDKTSDSLSGNLPDRIVFIADAHLGIPGATPSQSERFTDFLRHLRGNISHLYIVGDLFDFWFEYKSVVPRKSPRVIFELYNLVRDGVQVVLFAGNHDYWLGSYLSNDVGLQIVRDGLTVEHQGRRMYLHHGDGLYPNDHGYRLLKRILRNKVSIFLFSILHPDLAAWIAKICSNTSRKYASLEYSNSISTGLFRDIADECLKENAIDTVIYGHAHVPLIEERPGGTLALLGDWIMHDSYVVLENGSFTLKYWHSPENSSGENAGG